MQDIRLSDYNSDSDEHEKSDMSDASLSSSDEDSKPPPRKKKSLKKTPSFSKKNRRQVLIEYETEHQPSTSKIKTDF